MNYFETNLECIKENRKELYDKLTKFIKNHEVNASLIIQSEMALDGDSYLLVKKDNILHRLNSSYSPKNEAEKWVEQYSFTNMNVVISIFGFGSGFFARELMNHKGENDIVIIYEPSIDVFIHTLYNYDITDIISESSMGITIEGINEFEFHQMLRGAISITNIFSQIKCTHPGYEELFTEGAVHFWKEIKDAFIHVRMNINTEKIYGKRIIANSLINARYIKSSICLGAIKEVINTNIPAIIVAAGPSVEESIKDLVNAKEKAYIFAVDRILDYLLDSGIEPDFVGTVDPVKDIKYFSRRSDIETPLLCCLDSNWEVLKHHIGKKIVYSTNPFFQRLYISQKKVPPLLDTGASVATVLFSICIQLGFKKIILVGQDLAYYGDLTHAGGATDKSSTGYDTYVEGVSGEKVRTRHDWYEFLSWFNDAIFLNPDVEVIDTKNKGAKIQGVIQKPLSDAISNYEKHIKTDISKISDIANTFSEEEMKSVRLYINDSYQELRNIVRKSKEAIVICESQIRTYKNNYEDNYLTNKNYKKLSRINEYISRQPIYLMLETFITAEAELHLSEMYSFTEDHYMDKLNTFERSIEIYKAIIAGAEYAKQVYDENVQYI